MTKGGFTRIFYRELFDVAINRKFTNLLYNVDNLQNFEIRSLGHVITNTIFVPRSDRSDSGGISPPRRIGRHLFNIYWNGSVHWSSKLWKRGVYGGIDSLTDDFSRENFYRLIKFFSNIFERIVDQGRKEHFIESREIYVKFFSSSSSNWKLLSLDHIILENDDLRLFPLASYRLFLSTTTVLERTIGDSDRSTPKRGWKMDIPRSIC